ncbi:MAG: cation:proton antiporter [Thermoguttaceae bacterium]|nr:cation:proton antiporter [Thermoguttaceae bacterium]
MPHLVLFHLTVILFAGFIVGWICKRLNVSLLIGYMLVGAIIGQDCFGLIDAKITSKSGEISKIKQEVNENVDSTTAEELVVETKDEQMELIDKTIMECIAEFGVLLLLFSIGVEFTLDKMASMSKYMFVGGALQMTLTGVPTALFFHFLAGWGWGISILVGFVFSLSSTALAYKSLQDEGVAASHRAKGTLGVLLFQDVALVPMLLLVPVLSGESSPDVKYWFGMAIKTVIFCVIVVLGKILMMKHLAAKLAKMRAKQLLIALVLALLMGLCSLAVLFGLTPALGALAAGIVLGENRLTSQIEALFEPFSESFSAMFFISLGMLMDFHILQTHPWLCFGSLIAVILLKTIAAAGSLKICGFKNRSAVGYGLCVAQVGELAFMLLMIASTRNMISDDPYHVILFLSVASMVITPHLVKTGIWISRSDVEPSDDVQTKSPIQQALDSGSLDHVIVIGVGHIGTLLAARLETMGKVVSVVDYSPINIYRFAQEGITAISGDASKPDILTKAGIEKASAVFVTIPDDMIALDIVRACHDMNPDCSILCRVRYNLNIKLLQRAGADMVVCEETTVCNALLKLVSGYN